MTRRNSNDTLVATHFHFHLIHRLDWNGCEVRMKMYGKKIDINIYHSMIQKW